MPDERPLVSAILPVYNVKDSVKSAVDSVLAQTYTPIEILVADNGSWDGTLEVLRSYGARIRLFHQPKRGAYPTRNRALREAHGKYVAFLDGDDVWLPEKTEKQVRLLEEWPEIGMVYTGRFVVNYRVSPPHRRQDPPPDGADPPSGRIFNRLVYGNFISNSSVMARRSCIEDYGFFSEKEPIGADYHMWLRISADHVVECLREPLIEYAVHQTNISRDRIANLRSMIRHFDDLIANVQQPECRQALKRARLVLDYDMALRSWGAGWESFVRGVQARNVENPGIGFFRRLALFGRLALSRLRSGN
jgi:glycosyltransferase involved in cell wall biosynthesis